ncbi:MAG: glycerol-3-phosphate acyltransferase [Anaerolineae bacterium]
MIYIFGVVAILVSYLCGSIPMGFLVARIYGVDLMSSGSGKTGGTNVLRSVGRTAAALTVLGDILKGLIPVYLLAHSPAPALITALAAAAVVIGHNHSIFLGFRGGVGAGTAIGALGGMSFPAGLIVAICGLTALGLSRYASILSTTIAVSTLIILTLFAFLNYTPFEYIISAVLNLIVMLYALRPNFARLRAGTERRVGQKPENIVRVSPPHH